MRQRGSRQFLPLNTMLFSGSSERTSWSPRRKSESSGRANPTLANLQEAQDETITALPLHPVAVAVTGEVEVEQMGEGKEDVAPVKESVWARLVTRCRRLVCLKGRREKQDEGERSAGAEEEKAREKKGKKGKIVIGEPMGFRHVGTATPTPTTRSVQLVDGDNQWEDME
ncbi:hypothetical protein GMOD_00005328 [Pyrenophora seminiperda CCB06]|uniref:Uncharacterized protein n=1 Tax=Pyrenophora seminiperda CCB06 TaxID=1302712 RepID=A0A3M7LVJ6_9PLEO|nr:hypothetical protein GMOD_00005328 [Pyrenophora seminiperda CCB06]